MGSYVFSNRAVDDLSAIWNYTREAWSESQADKYYHLIIETCKEISKHPDIGRIYNEISDKLLGFRVGKHIIFYREIKSRSIEIVRILHGRMDLKRRMDD